MIVRPAEPGDEAAVDDVLHDALGTVVRRLSLYRPLHGPPADAPRVRRSFVAVDGERVVGVGSAMASNRHLGRNQLAVHVRRDRRREGIGEALLLHLEDAMAAAGCARPWQATVLATDSVSMAVLDHLRWQVLTTSRSGTLDVDASGVRLRAVPTVPITAVAGLDDELVELYERIYDEHHAWAQPYVRCAGGVPWISLLGEPLPGSVHVARDLQGRPVAVASLHGDAACPLLAPFGAVQGTADSANLVAALVAAVLQWCALREIAEIEWEADDAYDDLWAALRPRSLDRWDDLLVYGSP